MKATKKLMTVVSTGVIEFNVDNFDENMQAILCVNGTLQENVQRALEFAVFEACKDGRDGLPCHNMTFITKLINYVALNKYGQGMRTKTIQEYLEAIVKGCVWTKVTKNGETKHEFKKRSKKTKIQYCLDVMESKKWYEFNDKGRAIPTKDLKEMLANAVKQWYKAEEKAENGEAIIVDQEINDTLAAQVQSILDSLQPATTNPAS